MAKSKANTSIPDTQIEQIRNAKRAYVIHLNNPRDGMSKVRYAIYTDSGNGLEVLWPNVRVEEVPGTNDYNHTWSTLLPHQVHTERREYPAFHFALSGCGYSKTYELQDMLRRINPSIELLSLNGFSPSRA